MSLSLATRCPFLFYQQASWPLNRIQNYLEVHLRAIPQRDHYWVRQDHNDPTAIRLKEDMHLLSEQVEDHVGNSTFLTAVEPDSILQYA